MPRLLFEKKGNAVWISHLDLMRQFQRAFQRAGLPLKHTQGFNPRPSVSIALPLSVGVESCCELLDFDLDGQTVPEEEILRRLNLALVEGIRVRAVYSDGRKIKHLSLLDCAVELEYDTGIPQGAGDKILALFHREEVTVEKKSKNGPVQQNLIPMIRNLRVSEKDANTLVIHARVCCQNPTLNPAQLVSAVCGYLPQLTPDFAVCRREEIYDVEEKQFR